MPYPTSHALITVGGDAWLSTETWQFGVRAIAPVQPTNADLQTVANTLAAPTQTFFSAVAISNRARLLTIKVAWIEETGLYPPDSVPGIYTYAPPVAGTSASNAYPQITQAVTLHTEIPRGRASKGRFYLPPHGLAVGTDGRLSAADADGIETAARTWLLAINAVAELTEVVVMSKLGTGRYGTVTGVSVGRVVDTMRSRRRSLDEGRTTLPL